MDQTKVAFSPTCPNNYFMGRKSKTSEAKTPTEPKVNVGIDRSVNEDLDRVLDNMKIKRTVLNRMVRWFLSRPDIMRAAIVGDIDKGMRGHYADELELLADGLRKMENGERAAEFESVGEIESKSPKPMVESVRDLPPNFPKVPDPAEDQTRRSELRRKRRSSGNAKE